MIYDKIDNFSQYFSGDTRLAKAAEFAKTFDFNSPEGRYEIDGENIFALYQHLTTKNPEGALFETHQKYIDIQVVYDGEVMMGHSLDTSTKSTTQYNPEKDVQKFSHPNTFTKVNMCAGEFVTFFPQDYHMPDCFINEPKEARKLVLKILV